MNKKILYKNLKNLVRSLNIILTREGTYRFVVKNWDRLEDVNLVENIMRTDFFKDTIDPQPLPINKFEKFLILAPHQDDESIGAGGLMLFLKDYKKEMDVIFITDGAQIIKGYTTKEVSAIRNSEAEKALNHTGARIHQLPISNLRMNVEKEHVKLLSDLISQINPDIILLPWLLDTPVKHRATNNLLFLANKAKKIKSRVEIWSYQVHNSIYPNAYLDITSKVNDKRQMIKSYRSQNENFINYDHIVVGMNAWNSRFLNYKPQMVRDQFVELYFTLPIDKYLDLIERYYISNIDEVYKGREELIKVMKAINNEYLSMS